MTHDAEELGLHPVRRLRRLACPALRVVQPRTLERDRTQPRDDTQVLALLRGECPLSVERPQQRAARARLAADRQRRPCAMNRLRLAVALAPRRRRFDEDGPPAARGLRDRQRRVRGEAPSRQHGGLRRMPDRRPDLQLVVARAHREHARIRAQRGHAVAHHDLAHRRFRYRLRERGRQQLEPLR